jgi:hypothetical protein
MRADGGAVAERKEQEWARLRSKAIARPSLTWRDLPDDGSVDPSIAKSSCIGIVTRRIRLAEKNGGATTGFGFWHLTSKGVLS